ncbi:ABC transporter ATP-binding protein [Synechococcus sp. HB1133]|uniref:ABC transporter ATP-binding protein n=1 Tax=unclassified Synechococcus TaxID=2626047 RepID=UPI00140BC398|nr:MULTISPECIES: ABC transporter ATP-binding protein [unclassified Synechococcus]MCB4423144.1 ABC transporter ATP-binding protein [Synechococcus sp. HB1133]MCB4429442.1 ABC transporter ATP-binding protein [Synechococcus sp. HBA1120]NHI82092.1 ABC transporter ATP-binding protein [Synechococcus sp. HB1133]
MAGVRFEDLSKTYPARGGGDPVEVIRQLNLTIQNGEFLVLVGPSGCGKSTLLRLLAGLDTPTSGEIRIGSRPISGVPPARRNVAMVFQSYALYPHLSVRDNLSFGLRRSQSRSTLQRIQDQAFRATRSLPNPLRVRSVREQRIDNRIDTVAKSLELTELLDRWPKELSGGQKQRVALGRAMARNPEVFLMDEPLSNLDAKLRTSTRQRIVELQRELGTTTVYVTHDQVEAMTMGHRIAVLNQGRLQQLGTPMELYQWPSNIFVAQFIGSPPMCLMPVTVGPNGALILGGKRIQVEGEIMEQLLQREGEQLTAGLRPEHWHVAPATNRNLKAKVSHCERLGNEQILTCRLENGGHLIQVRSMPEVNVSPGDQINLESNPRKWRLFGNDGEAIK